MDSQICSYQILQFLLIERYRALKKPPYRAHIELDAPRAHQENMERFVQKNRKDLGKGKAKWMNDIVSEFKQKNAKFYG